MEECTQVKTKEDKVHGRWKVREKASEEGERNTRVEKGKMHAHM